MWAKQSWKGDEMERVGMVGTGAMGSALLERLTLAGVQATVFDIAPSALETARSLGAKVAPSAKAVAQAATIIDVVVRTDQEVLDCTMGEDGILQGAAAGTLVLLHSTILPDTTKKVAEAGRERHVHVIDACMTAVPRVVRQGGLTFLVGGPAELVQRAKPHLLNMAKEVIHMGPLGAGNVAKLIKNLVTATEALIVNEAIRIGLAGGIPCEEALEMMRKTQSPSILTRWQERFEISEREAKFRYAQNLYDKDIPLAAEVGRRLGVEIPITEQLAASGLRLRK
jgi:3-hydroxyisobutyrate dehydrogenase-like beta-hydroxyacid dehydrogenase